jgi:hypothetical protein
MSEPTIALGPAGIQFIAGDDPTGNGQESLEVVYRPAGSDTVVHSNVFIQRHAGDKLRFVRANAPGGAEAIFEIDGNGKVEIVG